MSLKLLAGCRTRGCIERAIPGSIRCAKHTKPHTLKKFADNKAKAFLENRAGTADGFYKTKAWRNLRILHLHSEPTCRACGAPAEMVDHVTPLHEGGQALDPSNLQSLCNRCHAAKRGHEGYVRLKEKNSRRVQ